jgi:tRNA 5-methylaminomethyl-2-thiouridine biosynthesis bifunctional protein
MKFANLIWHENSPYSIDFNDVYFNSLDGLAETEFVFILQNQLKERFASPLSKTFTIIETGFGTGLNFYCAASHWLTTSPKNTTLHYISIEKFPLKIEDMRKVSNFWQNFKITTDELLLNYEQINPHLNIFNLAEKRILLHLYVDDISTGLSQITQHADAWFLDGFAPAKNAEMWSDEVFKQIARLSNSGTTFATFTSASLVRRGLDAVGFDVQKLTGFGKKREMLRGIFA